jgi:dynein heavy chain 2
MKGVSDLSERPGFFRPIVDAVPGGMARVYAAAEALFVQLADELKKYQVGWGRRMITVSVVAVLSYER